MLIVDTLAHKETSEVPFWFMRQAGRYLPEYKKVRAQFPNFLEFCYTPEAACEVTLQPIDRFGMSAAIIFSDILVIPHALGANVWFEEKKGPQLTPILSKDQLKELSINHVENKLAPVYEAISLTRKKLAADKALIGFCGSPWTLACYMVEGKGSRDFASVRSLALRDKEFFAKLIQLLAEAVLLHAKNQIKAGANIIQLFDSWSGVLSEPEFEAWVIDPTEMIVAGLNEAYPHIPVIGFPRMSGDKMFHYAVQTQVNAINFDHSVSLDYARDVLQPQVVVQGNLDSILLADDKEAALAQAKHIIGTLGKKPFIFNLAHGIVPHTPIAHVEALCELIRTAK